MNSRLLFSALASIIMTGWSVAGDLQLRKLSEEEMKSGIPYLSSEFGFRKLGFFEFQPDVTLLQFVAFSGGILPNSGGDAVRVLRDDKVLSASIRQILGDPSKDIILKPGDRVISPNQGCFGGGFADSEIASINERIKEIAGSK